MNFVPGTASQPASWRINLPAIEAAMPALAGLSFPPAKSFKVHFGLLVGQYIA
jgi:hypothetical protein